MTNKEARQIFDDAAANEPDPEKRANIELCREYFTNPEFRRGLADMVAKINGLP